MNEDRLPETMTQTAPYPVELHDLVDSCQYRDGWHIRLDHLDRGQGSEGLTLQIFGRYPNSYRPDEIINVVHYFIVPAAAYDRRSWTVWLFERFLDVERHEAMEHFVIDGERPFAPHHGPGNDPYFVFIHGTDEDRRTSFRGEVKPEEGPPPPPPPGPPDPPRPPDHRPVA